MSWLVLIGNASQKGLLIAALQYFETWTVVASLGNEFGIGKYLNKETDFSG